MRSLLGSFCTVAVALAGLGAAPQPQPAASEGPTPLKEIGRVRTSVCSTIVAHANSAIDGALYRQRMMAIDTQRLLAVQQGWGSRAEVATQTAADPPSLSNRAPNTNQAPAPLPLAAPAGSVDQAFRSVAAEFVERAKLITADEGVAAGHSLGATTGC